MIKLKDINLSLGGKTIFQDFNLEIKKGEKILLDSPSGRGKSTLLKMIMGFIRPESGAIYFQGERMERSTIDKLRKAITWVNQDVNLRKLKVEELILEIESYSANKRHDFSRKRLLKLLDDFSLSEDLLSKDVENLSGGERQRLGFIIALLLDRDILLLDEVTSSLDIEMKKKVEEYIKKSDKTVLLISHDTHWDIKNFKVVRW